MPLELYLRGETWWLRGKIDELPQSQYYRQSTGKTEREHAEIFIAEFRVNEIKTHYVGETNSFLFAEAVTLYDPSPEFAGYLLKVMPYLEHLQVKAISPQMVRDLGPKISPKNSTDTWHKQFIVPVRAVINHSHDLGLCPPIKIKTYSKTRRQKQDRLRGKLSRAEKTPGSWEWVLSFKEAADPYTGLLCQFMFETAARIGQAIKIEVDDLDIKNCRVWMPEAKGIDAQWVDLSPELTAELAALRPKFPRYNKHKKRQNVPPLFGYARPDSVRKKWKQICHEAKIEVLMPHAAGRHGFATEMLVRNKLDPQTVADAGRWADTSMLFENYSHSEDTKNKILKAIRTGRVQAQKKKSNNSLNSQEGNEK